MVVECSSPQGNNPCNFVSGDGGPTLHSPAPEEVLTGDFATDIANPEAMGKEARVRPCLEIYHQQPQSLAGPNHTLELGEVRAADATWDQAKGRDRYQLMPLKTTGEGGAGDGRSQ